MSPSSSGAATGRTTSQPTTRDGGSGSCSTADRYCEEARFAGGGPKGPSEKLLVPTFSGEGDGGELGASARSYLRQVAAWERMTKLSRSQRALVLYQHLAGAAWVNAESLEMERLGSEGGVDYLREWVQQHRLDVEVTQIGRSLSDLFRKLKRRPTQTFRDYVAEYNRLLARVTECGCRLPDTACAWLFVDRAALDEGTEVSLLASVGNKYDLRLLQQAAIILDRSSRKVWERTSRAEPYRKHQTVHHTEDTMADEGASDSDGPPLHDDVDDDGEGLYVAYMTAKAKYKDHGKARGVDVEAVKRTAEARIQAAKAKSFCAACGQRGHWHKDAACPKRRHEDGQGGDVRTAKPQTIHIANEVFELRVDAGKSPLLAITDSACSRSVMGTAWFQRYLDMAGGSGREVELIQERESFRFGASRVYESSFAAVVMIPFGSSWVAVRAAVVHGDIPLLLSRPLLASLGMVMDLATNRASFKAVDLMDYQLLTTETGHPAVPVDHSGRALPDLTRLPKSWGPDGVAVIGPQRAYMVAQACGAGDYGGIRTGPALPGNGVGRIFYEKRIDPAVKNMLLADFLNHEAFLNWWCTSSVGNDFWIEHPERLVRVHVIPRKSFFDPRKCQTQYGLQRDLLLQSLGDLRETWGISCSSQRALSTVCECWRGQESVSTGYPTLWIGRSLFSRATLPERISVGPAPGGHGLQGNMENEQGRALQIPTSPAWTVLELRTILANDKKMNTSEKDGVPKKLTTMTLEELRATASGMGLEVGKTENKGAIMLLIRDHAAPDSTVLTLGRFKGSRYTEIPETYGAWASEEERQNGANMHPDLKRFVVWRRNRRRMDGATSAASKTYDFEEHAKIPPPPISETGSTCSHWTMVSERDKPYPPKISGPDAKAKSKRRQGASGSERMEQTVPDDVREEIAQLETKLAALRDRAGLDPGPEPRRERCRREGRPLQQPFWWPRPEAPRHPQRAPRA